VFTPPVTTADVSSHQSSRSLHTRYERVLAATIAAALTVVATLALLLPPTSTPPTGGDGPASSVGQPARGKATVPSFWTSGRATGSSVQL
jgi:hypothetical protein